MVGEREAGSSGTLPAQAKRSNHLMNTETVTHIVTGATAEPVTAPVLRAACPGRRRDQVGYLDGRLARFGRSLPR